MQEKNRGSILLYVLFAMSILMLLGSVFLSYALSELRIAQNFTQNMQAYYAAEAGIELAISFISSGSVLQEGSSLLLGSLGGAHYETVVETEEGVLTLVSRGVAGTAIQVVRAEVIREETPEPEPGD